MISKDKFFRSNDENPVEIIDSKNGNWERSLSETENLLLSRDIVNIKKSEYAYRELNVYDELLENLNQKYQPFDTGRKLNVQKTFTRRPRHLCTFKLPPVSRGEAHIH